MAENRAHTNIIKGILLLAFMLLVLLLHPLGVEASSQTPEYIRVGLKYDSTSASECNFFSSEGFVLGSVTDNMGFIESLPLPGYSELVASVNNGHVELRDTGGVLISADIGINGCLMPYDSDEGGLLSIDGQVYRGGIVLKVNHSNTLKVINYLTLDEYLYGVIHREMSMDNPLEALKAQAVAARTFAVVNRDRHSSNDFDICATEHCQVYGGYKDEYASTNRAVDETSEIILRYQDEAAEAFYHKNSGGHTQNSEDVWFTPTPYLRGVVDPYSPEYSWRAVISFDSLQQKLIQAQQDPGNIESVQIGGRDDSGAVSSLVIKGDEREVNLTKSNIRAILGSSLVRSRHFSLGTTYEGGNQPLNSSGLELLSADERKFLKGSDTLYVLRANGTPKKTSIASLSMSNGNITDRVEISESEGRFDDSEVATGGTLILSGLGYGHGVGMSQDGAIEMAKQGKDYIDILKFYFTDIEVN